MGKGWRAPGERPESRTLWEAPTGLTGSFVPGVSAGRTASHLHTDLSKPVHEKIDSQWPGPLSQPWSVLGGKLGKKQKSLDLGLQDFM